jgi:hypothetical protein
LWIAAGVDTVHAEEFRKILVQAKKELIKVPSTYKFAALFPATQRCLDI